MGSGFLVFVIIILISAVSSWLQRKREADKARDAARNPPPSGPRPAQYSPAAAPRPAKTTSWEEELRRLLEGETPSAPPARPRPAPPPPPTVVTSSPRTPALPPSPFQPVVRTTRPVPAPPPIRPVIVRVPEPSPTPLPVPTVTSVGTRDLAAMSQSRQAYERASQLDQQVGAHIAKVSTQRVQLTSVVRTKASPEVVQAAGMFKNARTVRQAVIASLILGPPRALEQESGGI